VRELQNVIERWSIICDGEDISMDESWLPREPTSSGDGGSEPEPIADEPTNLVEQVEDVERRLIRRTMEAVGGNQSEAARRLGMSRGALLGRLRKYGQRC
jgi:two-component system response regulator AtoC